MCRIYSRYLSRSPCNSRKWSVVLIIRAGPGMENPPRRRFSFATELIDYVVQTRGFIFPCRKIRYFLSLSLSLCYRIFDKVSSRFGGVSTFSGQTWRKRDEKFKTNENERIKKKRRRRRKKETGNRANRRDTIAGESQRGPKFKNEKKEIK